jgi:hypothetical protein
MPRFLTSFKKTCGHPSDEYCDCAIGDEDWLVPPEKLVEPLSTYDKVAEILVTHINKHRGVSNVPMNIDYDVTFSENGMLEWEIRHQITGAKDRGYGAEASFLKAMRSFALYEDAVALAQNRAMQ